MIMNIWKSGNFPRSLYSATVKSAITPYIWGLDNEMIDSMYRYTNKDHLEIGPGPDPYNHNMLTDVTYVDINKSVLDNINHPFGTCVQADILEADLNKRFMSAACINVMHCIPEPNKWSRMFFNTKNVLVPEGVLFGASVLDKHPFSKFLNAIGWFHNKHDSLESIETLANPYFDTLYLEQIGHCAVFAFRKR